MKNLKSYQLVCEGVSESSSVAKDSLVDIVDSFSMCSKEDLLWQLGVLEEQFFQVPCPYTGEEVKCFLTFKVGYQFFFVFKCGNGKHLVLFTSDAVDSGFPIVGLSIPEDSVFLCRKLGDKYKTWTSIASEVVRLAIDGVGDRIGSKVDVLGLVQGHKNFAHCLINIFPAVNYVSSNAKDPSRLAFCTSSGSHPLGDPEDVFNNLSFVQVNKLDVGSFEIYSGAVIPLGIGQFTYGVKIQKSLRDDVLAWAQRESSKECRDLVESIKSKKHGFIIWISIRGYGARNAKNFNEVVSIIINLVSRGGGRPAVIFDGLSLQNGFSLDDSVRGGGKIRKQISEEIRVAEEISSRLEGRCDFYNGIGMRLADSFLLSSVATAYFCHDGSLQHKIGWVRPEIPGIIHGNHQRNRGQGKGWHPVEGGYAPRYIPPEYIVDLKDRESFVSSANYPYEFISLKEIESFLASFLENPINFCCV